MQFKKGLSYRLLLAVVAVLVCMLALSGMVMGDEDAPRYLKKRVAVADFENKVEPWWHWKWNIGQGMSEMLVTALVDTDRFVVLERQALEDIIAEQDLAEAGRVTEQTAAEAGKLLGAQALIRGAITEFSEKKSGGQAGIKIGGVKLGGAKASAHVAVDVRMYDTETGEVLSSESVDGSAETTALAVGVEYEDFAIGGSGFSKTPLGKATRKVIEKTVALIVKEMEQIPWEGRVVTVKGEKIYLNAGENLNVRIGDVFRVIEQGEELVDPQTGLVLGAEEAELGTVRVVEVKEKYSIAHALHGSGFAGGNVIRE